MRGSDGPKPPGAAAQSARRDAGNTELVALPAAVDWPNLEILWVPAAARRDAYVHIYVDEYIDRYISIDIYIYIYIYMYICIKI
jgi:hypothetical protein